MLLIQRPEIKALDEESENKQRFLISPLEPGFGHTLGNSLRRTLLSAIPGAAITHVLFDNAIHEFDVIDKSLPLRQTLAARSRLWYKHRTISQSQPQADAVAVGWYGS